jgi:dihydroorotate dehydrogenase
MDWSGTGFSGKTLTLLAKTGNMPLKDDGTTPQELIPRCIWTNFQNGGEIMNAVGLSNFGTKFYLKSEHFQKFRTPFFISFMCLAQDKAGREAELRDFCRLLQPLLILWGEVILQLNFGCPNSGHDLSAFWQEICTLVAIVKSTINIPIFINTNALMPTSVFKDIAWTKDVDGLWIGNTIPFREPSTLKKIDWSRFGDISPIRRRGIEADGGLSSPQCLPLTIDKVRELRDCGVHLPIVAGNGIRTTKDINDLKNAGANAVFIGSLAIVRPWQMQTVIKYANNIL